MTRTLIRACLLVALGALAQPASAALRCGSRIITEGDTAGELLARCGQPDQVETRSVRRPPIIWEDGRPWRVPGDDIIVKVEIWTYNLGSNRLMRRITLEDGRVKTIETLGYGYP